MKAPPALNVARSLEKYDDSVLFEMMVTGHGTMPGFGPRFTVENARQIISYARFLNKDKQ
jgi:hypothetical protein